MDRIATILAIVDPTAAQQIAVDKAAFLAKRLGAHNRTAGLRGAAGSASAPKRPGCSIGWRSRCARAASRWPPHAVHGDPLHERLVEVDR